MMSLPQIQATDVFTNSNFFSLDKIPLKAFLWCGVLFRKLLTLNRILINFWALVKVKWRSGEGWDQNRKLHWRNFNNHYIRYTLLFLYLEQFLRTFEVLVEFEFHPMSYAFLPLFCFLPKTWCWRQLYHNKNKTK